MSAGRGGLLPHPLFPPPRRRWTSAATPPSPPFTVLQGEGAIGPGTYALHTRSGDLSIQVGADAVWMDMAPPPTAGAFRRRSRRSCTPPTACPLADRPEGLEAQAVSTGLLDILLPVRDLAALERAEQNEGEVTRLSERYGVVGVHMFCPSTPDAAAHCRNFAPCTPSREEGRPPAPPTGR